MKFPSITPASKSTDLMSLIFILFGKRAKCRMLFHYYLFTGVGRFATRCSYIFSHVLGPGSFLEVLPLLPLLSRPDGPAFDIIAPSLPNFGFSSSVKQRGFAAKQYAEVCHKLMIQLGYDQYVTQGGDWGFIITRSIGLAYPQHVKASHLNMFRGLPPTMMKNPISAFKYAFTPYSAREKAGLGMYK